MGGSVSKVLEPLGGKPVLLYSFETLAASPWVKELCVVCREEDSQQVQALLSGKQTSLCAWCPAAGSARNRCSTA